MQTESSGYSPRRRVSAARRRKPDGSWYGRWGVNYIYGTFLALRGLRAAGCERERAVHSAGARIHSRLSESRWRLGRKLRQLRRRAALFQIPARLRKPPGPFLRCLPAAIFAAKASTTASNIWSAPSGADGTWDEEYCTGTGFPRVFYLCYTEYRNSSRCWRCPHSSKTTRSEEQARCLSRPSPVQSDRNPKSSARLALTLVTGASGFLGWHVARLLIERGHRVRALLPARQPDSRARRRTRQRTICAILNLLKRACNGCEMVFHVAADYRLWSKNPQELYARMWKARATS